MGQGSKIPPFREKAAASGQFVSTCRSSAWGEHWELWPGSDSPSLPSGMGIPAAHSGLQQPCSPCVPRALHPLLLNCAQVIATRGSSGSKYTSVIAIYFDILRILYNELSSCITSINLMRRPFMEQS